MAGIKEIAYKQVFGRQLTDEDLKKPEHSEIINNAPEIVMTYNKLYPGETELDRDRRFEIESALDGEATELADYFKNLHVGKYEGMTSWQIVFTLYKDITDKTAPNTEDVVKALSGQTVGDTAKVASENSQSINTSKQTHEGGNRSMDVNGGNLDNALEALKATGATAPQSTGSTKPVIDDATMAAANTAARSIIDGDRNARVSFTRAAKVTRPIAMQPPLATRLLPNVKATLVKDGNKDTATKKAENIWKNWCEKTGRRVTESGNIVYDLVRNDSIEAAQKVDAWLQELKADPLAQLDLATPSTSEQLKGGYVTTPDNPAEEAMNQREILKLIMDKTLGRLNTSCPTSQYVARKATGRVSTAGTQGTEAVSKSQDPWKGVATVAIIHKADFVATGVQYAYELDKAADPVLVGVKVQLPGKVYYKKKSQATAEDAAEKYSLFSVNAFAESTATKLNPDLKKFEKKESSRIQGVNAKVLDFSSEEDINASANSFSSVIASYIAANNGSVPAGSADVIVEAAKAMQATTAKAVAAETEAMADIDA